MILIYIVLFGSMLGAILGIVIGAMFAVAYSIWWVSMHFPWPVLIVTTVLLIRISAAFIEIAVGPIKELRSGELLKVYASDTPSPDAWQMAKTIRSTNLDDFAVNFGMPITEWPSIDQVRHNWVESQRFGHKDLIQVDDTISTLNMSEFGAERYTSAFDKAEGTGEQVAPYEATSTITRFVKRILSTDLRFAYAICRCHDAAKKYELDNQFKHWIFESEYFLGRVAYEQYMHLDIDSHSDRHVNRD